MSVDEGPTLRRRRLGSELKRFREAAGLTQQQVSRHFEWHTAKVTRIETARVAVTARDVKDLLDLYNVRDREHFEALVQLARSSRQRAWWAEYRDIVRPDSFISLEAEASLMRNWEPVVIPGLLQTEAYMRALFSTRQSLSRRMNIDRAVSVRLTRQRRLTSEHPIELVATIDESVIRRPIGGEHIMAQQLRHLLAMSQLPSVTLRIRPHDAGEHPLLGTSLAILEFHEATDLDIVYVEGFGQSRHLKQPAEVTRYKDIFQQLSAQCLDHQQMTAMIEESLPS